MRPVGLSPRLPPLPSQSFADILRQILDPAEYRVEESRVWAHARSATAPLVEQGWKLHVTASSANAAQILRASARVIVAVGASFKVASNLDALLKLNTGESGETQKGKFITVYPRDLNEALFLAERLHQATFGMKGPPIPSDRRYRDGSPVYYRYGGISTGYIQSPIGELVPYIRTPDDRLVEDRRGVTYTQPEWVTDPFGGVDSLPEAELLSERYLTVIPLYRSPHGSVWSGVDLVARKTVVVKQSIRISGTEGRLEREAKLLAELGGGNFPVLLKYLPPDADGTETLVLEDDGGVTLGEWLSSDPPPSRRRRRRVATSIVNAVGELHSRGIVHRDLKSANVLVRSDDSVCIIDFDIAAPPDTPFEKLPGRGTMGYTSPQQWDFGPADFADDIHALGSILYMLETGIEPSQAPDPFDVLARDPRNVVAGADETICSLIDQCMSSDRASRPSLERIGQALADEPLRRSRPRRVSTFDFTGTAFSLGDRMSREADLERHLNRPTIWDPGARNEGLPIRDLNNGDAGALLALAEISRHSRSSLQLDVLRRAAAMLPTVRRPTGRLHPGLYVGEGGCALAMLRAAETLGDASLTAKAVETAELVAAQPHFSPDLFNGSAGRARLHLTMYRATGVESQRRAAIDAIQHVLNVMTTDASGHHFWIFPEGFGTMTGEAQLGYAHGAAGIADVMLDMHEETGEAVFAETAHGVCRWIVEHAEPVRGSRGQLRWRTTPGGQYFGAFWCHGAAGIGRFLLRYLRSTAVPTVEGLENIVLGAAKAVRATRACGPSVCHGLAGNVGFLLDLHEWSGEQKWLDDAHRLAILLRAFQVQDEHGIGYRGDRNEVIPAFMTGYAGIAVTMLRLGGLTTAQVR